MSSTEKKTKEVILTPIPISGFYRFLLANVIIGIFGIWLSVKFFSEISVKTNSNVKSINGVVWLETRGLGLALVSSGEGVYKNTIERFKNRPILAFIGLFAMALGLVIASRPRKIFVKDGGSSETDKTP